MRIAIISDIHGNFVALETVLNDLKAEHIDRIVCLGDVTSGGPQPGEVIAQLKTLNCPVVMGNMDTRCLNPYPDEGKSKNAKRGNEVRSWVSVSYHLTISTTCARSRQRSRYLSMRLPVFFAITVRHNPMKMQSLQPLQMRKWNACCLVIALWYWLEDIHTRR